LHANTLEVPIYWEQIEPQPGKFDFSLIDTLLKQGQEYKVHLVLLWFATWKNGSSHYMPEWMKNDAAKYPNITAGMVVLSILLPTHTGSYGSRCKSFRSGDGLFEESRPQHTVIMVQVENEPGHGVV